MDTCSSHGDPPVRQVSSLLGLQLAGLPLPVSELLRAVGALLPVPGPTAPPLPCSVSTTIQHTGSATMLQCMDDQSQIVYKGLSMYNVSKPFQLFEAKLRKNKSFFNLFLNRYFETFLIFFEPVFPVFFQKNLFF